MQIVSHFSILVQPFSIFQTFFMASVVVNSPSQLHKPEKAFAASFNNIYGVVSESRFSRDETDSFIGLLVPLL